MIAASPKAVERNALGATRFGGFVFRFRLSCTLLSGDLAQVLHFTTDSCGDSKTDFQILGKVEFLRPYSCLSVRHACVTQTDNAQDGTPK